MQSGIKRVSYEANERETHGPATECDVALQGARCGVERMIHVIGDVASKQPVVGAVTEQVADWHGGVRESMDEQRFKYALRIVGDPAKSCNARDKCGVVNSFRLCSIQKNLLHNLARRLIGSNVPVEQPRPRVNPCVDEKWSSILHQKHGFPGNLRSQILSERETKKVSLTPKRSERTSHLEIKLSLIFYSKIS